MRAGIAIVALWGVASFSVAAWAQAPISNFVGTSPVHQNAAGCGCGAPAASACEAGGCGAAAGGGFGSRLGLDGFFGRDLDDPWTLQGFLHGDCEPKVKIGGWLSSGYHTADNGLFNDRPDEWNLHQAWLFAEKEAVAGESPFGFRADLVYGIDGADTQSFGNNPGTFDFENGFDHGAFSWALPQLYAELAVGDWNIKGGHFYTLIGYEVVTAPDNFFYSHAITFFNTEPFTHTGVLASRPVGENVEIFGGWTAGWDTGFDSFNGGSSWLGGVSLQLTENVGLTYASTAGNLGARGSDAYSHSIVFDTQLTENLQWVVQSDLLRVGSTGEDNVGLNQYLLYTLNDRVGLGARFEWWKGDVLTGFSPFDAVLPATGSLSYYSGTVGVNYRTSANTVLRPEVRFDWSPAAGYEEVVFGIDAVTTF